MCTEIGHRAVDCPIIPSVQRSGAYRCRECFIDRVDGRNVHRIEEFGRNERWKLSNISNFVLLSFSDEGLASGLRKMYSERTGDINPLTFGGFVEWVLKDTVDDRAAVFDVMEWLHAELELGMYGLKSRGGVEGKVKGIEVFGCSN